MSKYLSSLAGLVVIIAVVSLSLLSPQARPALGQVGETILSGYAWSSNIGWISFRGNNYGVVIHPSGFLSGYAWSSNIGWINFAPSPGADGYPVAPTHSAKFDQLTGEVAGWARALAPNQSGASGWDGWIKLSGNNYGVTRVSGTAGQPDHFRGYAWGDDVVGWMDWELVRIGGLSAVCAVTTNAGIATWSASVTGGTAPYSYSWTITDPDSVTVQTGTGPTIAFPLPIGGGSYTGHLALTDNLGRSTTCQAMSNVTVLPTITYPTLGTLNNQNNISITSQPLTSPAISSGITVIAETTSVATDLPLDAKVLDIVSLTSGKSLLKTLAEGGILAGTGNQKLPTCYWSRDSLSTGATFADCLAGPSIQMRGGDQAHFHLKIDRPVQAISANNPYEVTIGDENRQVSFLFDYRVATVNPI